ncbi:MAG: hypothetical protein SGARI_006679 [Bacillariaceae sp.]
MSSWLVRVLVIRDPSQYAIVDQPEKGIDCAPSDVAASDSDEKPSAKEKPKTKSSEKQSHDCNNSASIDTDRHMEDAGPVQALEQELVKAPAAATIQEQSTECFTYDLPLKIEHAFSIQNDCT